jgi:hypothetical protein
MLRLFFSAVSVSAVVIGVAGIVTFFLGLRRLVTAGASSKWPHVKGEILTAKLEEEADDSGEGGPKVFRAAVTYRYTVDGKAFEGDRIDLNDLATSNPAPAQDALRAFSAGSSVDVFYEPKEPSRSVLRPGISGASAILPSVGVVLVVLGLSMFGIVWKVSGH